MESKTFNQIEGRKKKKINGLFALSFFLSLSLISFSLIGCDGGGGGGGGGYLPASVGTINPALFSGWEMTNGPCSGLIPSLAFDPADSEVVYSITRKNHVYKSADGGISWNSYPTVDNETQENIWAQQLGVAPIDSQVLYLGTVSQGMYKSTDGGETWVHISNGLPETQYGYLNVDHILIDPADSNIVYVRLDMGYRIYKTVNGGQNWFEIYDGTAPPYNPANDMVIDPTPTIDPATTRVLYIGLWYAGVWKSIDGGINWTPKNNGLPQDLGGNISIFELAIDHQEPFRVYAGTFDYGLYRTDSGGDSWGYLEIFPGMDYQEILSLEVDPNDQFTIYVGVNDRDDSSKDGLWITTDGGWTWTQYFPFTWVWFIRIAPSNSNVFVDVDKWYKRGDPAEDWQQVQFDGIVDVRVNVLSQNLPFDSSSMYAGTECGVYQTTDSGFNWAEINNELTELVSPLYIYALAVDPNNFQKVYVGTYDDGVFLTTDGGEVWEERNTGLSNKYVQSLVIYPADSDVVYVGTRGGIFKTENSGVSWEPKNTGLSDLWIKCLAIDPTGDLANSVLYAGTGYEGESGKIFKTTNGGEMWVDVSNGLPDKPVRSLVIFPFDNQIVCAAFKGEGVYLTEDGGENWVQKNNGLLSTNVITLAISQRDSNIVCAGTEDEGVFATIDGGDNWVKIDGGLSCDLNRNVNSITISSNDEIAYAGTGCGVFKAYK